MTILLLQLAVTLMTLAFVKGISILKLVSFLICWNVTGLNMLKFSNTEWVFCVLVCACFTVLNYNSLSIGIFKFAKEDILLQPYWEFIMWPFYTLHTLRVIKAILPSKDEEADKPSIFSETNRSDLLFNLVAALLMSCLFGVIRDSSTLFITSSLLLSLILIKFHSVHDVAHVVYMQLLGYLIEITGVLSGEWHYPSNPIGRIPLWFLTMWGSVGFFSYKLVYPIIAELTKPKK
ncbi:predicted protein [Naegleria gruberi]|uniref:Predicted protein n=1 Tax=Naegleria gruberi TaxID=5762 RepID=D2VNV5_NAEGR|nr:uncharacterized protein NAEGRDRAFT_70632 [Naegleria gruberi]EFC41484.1 predicted protein [Naegleria gruberi]|eukprot:XP_002674228.1 predicted protein [Naegleria gruberi strain NEG-M]